MEFVFMKWCCAEFKDCVAKAGKRGIAIIVDAAEENNLGFLIQYRGTDFGNSIVVQTNHIVSLAQETGIIYCPWCGTNLRECYKRYAEKLSRTDLKI